MRPLIIHTVVYKQTALVIRTAVNTYSSDDTYNTVQPYSKEVLDNRNAERFPTMFRSCSETMEE